MKIVNVGKSAIYKDQLFYVKASTKSNITVMDFCILREAIQRYVDRAINHIVKAH